MADETPRDLKAELSVEQLREAFRQLDGKTARWVAGEMDSGRTPDPEHLGRTRPDSIPSKRATTKQLLRLIETARQRGFNRQIPDDVIERLDTSGIHLLHPAIFHHFIDQKPAPQHLRTMIQLKLRFADDPWQGLADFDQRQVERLTDLKRARSISRDPDWDQAFAMHAQYVTESERIPPAVSWNDDWRPLPGDFVSGLETWHVSRDMTTLIEFSADSMPLSHQLNTASDLVTPTGFAVLERPVFVELPEWGEVPIRAFAWKPAAAISILSERDRARGGLLVQALIDLEHELSPTDIRAGDYRGRLWPGMHFQWEESEAIEGVIDWTLPSPEEKTALIRLRKLAMALWLISSQRVTLVSGHRPVRSLRRQVESRKIPMPSTVVVLTLRREHQRPTEGGETHDVEWSHRWLVSGHWRRLWSESEQRERTVWISPYVKGPADRPLILKERHVRFVR